MRGQVNPHEQNKEEMQPRRISAGLFVFPKMIGRDHMAADGDRFERTLKTEYVTTQLQKNIPDIWKSGEIPAQFIPTVMKDESGRTIGKGFFLRRVASRLVLRVRRRTIVRRYRRKNIRRHNWRSYFCTNLK